MTIGKKLLVFGMLGSAIPLIIFGVIAVWLGSKNEQTASRESYKIVSDNLTHICAGVKSMVVSQQEVLQQKIAFDLKVAANELELAGGVSQGQDKVTWHARNQL